MGYDAQENRTINVYPLHRSLVGTMKDTSGILLSTVYKLDQSNENEMRDVLFPFALEEWWCRHMNQVKVPIIHLWTHPRAFVMGLRDSRLPEARAAKQWLEHQGYHTAVRNSGGLAVPLDAGVLNVSLLLPKTAIQMEFHREFFWMTSMIQRVVSSWIRENRSGEISSEDIRSGEIRGSFCPGEYDMSIGGRKFCGIAQRRLQQAVSVQAFIIVEGDGEVRAEQVKEFYRRATNHLAITGVPEIIPQVTASLSQALHQPITVSQVADHISRLLAEEGIEVLSQQPQMPSRLDIQAGIDEMKLRYGLDGG